MSQHGESQSGGDQTPPLRAADAHNGVTGVFDGHNMPLKDFLQDIRNGANNVGPAQQAQYISSVISKLKGSARDSIWGKTIGHIDDLVRHLKQRFAPGRDYAYYQGKLNSIRMLQGQTVGDFYDKLNILVNAAKNALRSQIPNRRDQTAEMKAQSEQIIAMTLQPLAINAFLRGLPDAIAWAVDSKKAETLEQAYEEAVRIEARMDARVLPDVRHRARPENPHAWEQAEYSSAPQWNNRPPRFDNRPPRSGQYPDQARYMGHMYTEDEDDYQGHYEGQVETQTAL